MPRNLLLVDVEPLALAGLQTRMRTMPGEWTIRCAQSGEEALAAMAAEPVDVIVTAMLMPGMDGEQLLDEVSRRSPETVRVALSGPCERETALRAIGSTHQYFSQPCDVQQLKDTINRTLALRGELGAAGLAKVVGQLKTIPSLPASFQSMMEELDRAEPRLNKLAVLIGMDMGMTAKLLQLVNSAFFGLRAPVSNPVQALALLGLDTLKSLILSTHIFSEFQTDLFDAEEIAWLWEHSFKVSLSAGKIAETQGVSPKQVDDALTAGLLHDTGKLVLASCMGREFKMVLELAATSGISLSDAEREVLGCGHAEVGAYLLGLWGLPDPIVEAVAWHLDPRAAPVGGFAGRSFSALTAVHAACAYHGSQSASRLAESTTIDSEYLAALGLDGRELAWFKTCDRSAGRGLAH